MTLQDFVDSLFGGDEHGFAGKIWLEDIQEELGSEAWQEWTSSSVSRESVILLARVMSRQISRRLMGICTDDLYKRTYDWGRAVLQEIYEKAIAHGIEVGPEEIHPSLTPTELFVAKGLIRQDKKGGVHLT
ncbi:MAG: hypothetical protein KJI72_02770 [Patescibacteria group bacterium]|nr:hypothetical protein [Patescibacteria group bacterium]